MDNRPVFDPEDTPEGSLLRPVFAFANSLHVTTRPAFILRELLFREGDCFDRLLLAESGRILRSYGFFDEAVLSSSEEGDGSRVVTVFTRDQWTTKLDLGLALDQGLQLERLQLAEENLLGRGILALVFMHRRRERRDLGFRVRDPRVLATRADASFGWGRTRVGSFLEQGVAYPFVGETGRRAFRQSVAVRDEAFAYSTGLTQGATHVLVPVRIDAAEISLASRFGAPGALTLVGFGASHERIAHSEFEGGIEVVADADFGSATPAPDSLRSEVVDRLAPYAATRLNLMVGQRHLRFERVRGLDALRGEQDVALGVDARATAGWSVGSWPASAPAADDLLLKFGVDLGWRWGSSYSFANATWQGRRRRPQEVAAEALEPRARDVLRELDVVAYLRTRERSRSTFLLRVSASDGRVHGVPFQLTLGGREGVRGLREEAFPGGRRWLFSAEERIVLDWPAPEYLDLGVTFFADVGRTWSLDVPFGTDSGWRSSLGFGLRFGYPAGTPRTARVDLAFPVGGPSRSPVLRIAMRELLGISRGMRDDQMERSRLNGIGPDRFVPVRR